MQRLVIRIKTEDQSEPELLEVPGDQPSRSLVSNLIKAINLPSQDVNGVPLEYWLEAESGLLIRDTMSLASAGVTNGSLLLVRSGPYRPEELSQSTHPVPSPAPAEPTKSSKGPVKGFIQIKPRDPK